MHDIEKIEAVVNSFKELLAENDSYAISPNWCHSTSLQFILELQSKLGGKIRDCTPEGIGWYLNF